MTLMGNFFFNLFVVFLAANARKASPSGYLSTAVDMFNFAVDRVEDAEDEAGCFGSNTTYFGRSLLEEVDMISHGVGFVDCFETTSHNICVTARHGFCLKGSNGVYRPHEIHAGSVLCSGEEVLTVERKVFMEVFSPESEHAISTDVTLHEIDTHGICSRKITTWDQARLVDQMFLELKPFFNDTESLRDLPETYCLRFLLSLTSSSAEKTAAATVHWNLLSNSTQEEAREQWAEFLWSWPHIKFLAQIGGLTLLLVFSPIFCCCCSAWYCYKRTKVNEFDFSDLTEKENTTQKNAADNV